MQQLYQTLVQNFTTNTQISTRLSAIRDESYQIYNQESTFKKSYEQILLSTWGYIGDILFSACIVIFLYYHIKLFYFIKYYFFFVFNLLF